MNAFFARIDQIPYKTIIWIFAVTETLHNIEEAVWLPWFLQNAGISSLPVEIFQVEAYEFRFAVILVTLLFYGMIYYFSISKSKLSGFLMGGALVAALINVFMPHLVAAILLGKYVPGVVTGILFNGPVIIYLLQRGMKENVYNYKMLITSGLFLTLITVPLLKAFFYIGGIMAVYFK